jgi:two-component sensor histidine kinase
MNTRNLPSITFRTAACIAAILAEGYLIISTIVQELYQSDNLSYIMLGAYIQSLSDNLVYSYHNHEGEIRLLVQTQEIATGIDYAVPIGLILNELISNSLKHAFPGERSGEIKIEFQREGVDRVLLRYSDDGVGLPDGFDLGTSKSLGMRLIYSLAKQLNAELEVTNQAEVRFDLRFSIETNENIPPALQPA